MPQEFEERLGPRERVLLQGLDSPQRIQEYLDSIPYSAEDVNRTPVAVLADGQAHCLDGGLFAAAALRRIGFPPVLVDMWPDPGTDDDHVLAVFKIDGHYGALAKSNFTGLRYREPIHRTVRELVLSYFEDYFNVNGLKTLRSYTRPLNLSSFDRLEWAWRDEGVAAIEHRLITMPRVPLITPEMAARLSPVERQSYEAGLYGSDPSGLYRPGSKG